MDRMDLVALRYIGGEAAWFDRLYGSQMWFERGRTYRVQHRLSRKLLAHIDLFEPVPDEDGAQEAEQEQHGAGSDGLPDDGLKDEAQKQEALFDLFVRIDQMDKDSLQVFIQNHFNQKVDKRLSEQNLREMAKNLIDQFGMPDDFA